MLRKFEFVIPLSLQDSFELIRKSGYDVRSWQTKKSDVENGYLEWKQHLWSFTGSAVIAAHLQQRKENRTSVEISVHKPFQVLDPLGLCNRIFNKLDKAYKKNLKELKNQAG